MKTLLTMSLFGISFNAFAFGDLGHSTTGYIAEKTMSPESKTFVYSIMGGEPMSLSATWPDQVRNDERFESFAPYHFFDFPELVSYENIPAEKIATKSADTILIKAPSLLQQKKLSVLQKQVIFRYYVHIMGDIHQPLHVGNTLDMGGNLCDVMVPQENGSLKKMNLHSFWDTALPELLKSEVVESAKLRGKKISYFSHKDLGDYLLEDPSNAQILVEMKSELKPGKRVEWLNESRSFHPFVYPDGKSVAPKDRSYCKILNENGKTENGKYDPTKIPTLSSEYIKESLGLVKKRILLAGLRLQSELDSMSKKSKKWSAKDEEKFFRPIMPAKDLKARSPSSKIKANLIPHHHCEH